jgi:sugar phosphate isomerase/epimerase
MALSAADWPISAALLQFPRVDAAGIVAQDADAEVWSGVFSQIARAGFADVDLTDSWVRPGDLEPSRLAELGATAKAAGLGTPAISTVRRSIIDAEAGDENLAYAHRTIDAAAALGASTVCLGLHQPLTEEQKKQLWFWTVDGHRDPDDRAVWELAVSRYKELGTHAAEVGVIISLELYEDTYLGTSASAVKLVTDIDLPSVGLNPDIGNLVRLHRTIEDWREIAKATLPYTNYWHVKNYARDENPATGAVFTVPAPMESGFVNYRELIGLAVSLGFQGVLCTEHYGGDGLSVAAANREYLRRILPLSGDYEPAASLVTQP